MKNWPTGEFLPISVCLLHAALVCGIWILVFKFDRDVMPGKLWMVLAFAWTVWVVAAVRSPPEGRRRWMLAIAIGMLVLAPAMPTLYTYTVWSIEGFAP